MKDNARNKKVFGIEVWGPAACFTEPFFKAERRSYGVITPAAARVIAECILWKPAIKWEVKRIEVMNPIVRRNIKRNEIGKQCMSRQKYKPIAANDSRQQRNTSYLADVRYRIYLEMEYLEPGNRPAEKHVHNAVDECPETQAVARIFAE